LAYRERTRNQHPSAQAVSSWISTFGFFLAHDFLWEQSASDDDDGGGGGIYASHFALRFTWSFYGFGLSLSHLVGYASFWVGLCVLFRKKIPHRVIACDAQRTGDSILHFAERNGRVHRASNTLDFLFTRRAWFFCKAS
jgi:hypothetical protein